jgi:hypothetical protein
MVHIIFTASVFRVPCSQVHSSVEYFYVREMNIFLLSYVSIYVYLRIKFFWLLISSAALRPRYLYLCDVSIRYFYLDGLFQTTEPILRSCPIIRISRTYNLHLFYAYDNATFSRLRMTKTSMFIRRLFPSNDSDNSSRSFLPYRQSWQPSITK